MDDDVDSELSVSVFRTHAVVRVGKAGVTEAELLSSFFVGNETAGPHPHVLLVFIAAAHGHVVPLVSLEASTGDHMVQIDGRERRSQFPIDQRNTHKHEMVSLDQRESSSNEQHDGRLLQR